MIVPRQGRDGRATLGRVPVPAQTIYDQERAARPRLRSLDTLWVVLLLLGPVTAGATFWLGFTMSRVTMITDFVKYRDCGVPLLDSAPADDAQCASHMNHLRLAVALVAGLFLFLLLAAASRVIQELRNRKPP